REQSAALAAVRAIVIERAKAGDVNNALALSESIEDPLPRSEVQAAVSMVQAEAGNVAGALETARRIKASYWLPEARAKNPYRYSETIIEDRWHFAALVDIAVIQT